MARTQNLKREMGDWRKPRELHERKGPLSTHQGDPGVAGLSCFG